VETLVTRPSGVSQIGVLLATLWRRGRERLARHAMLTAAAGSDVGIIRSNNEDYVLIADLARPGLAFGGTEDIGTLTTARALLVVADGMGGAAGGEIASAMAADVIGSYVASALQERRLRTGGQVRQALVEAFEAANRRIRHGGEREGELRGMGTTATAATVLGHSLHVAHVGDSRAYLVRDGLAQRLTKDHSVLQYLIDTGTADAAAIAGQQRNALLRALGTQDEILVDTCQVPLRYGDTVLLCTDGLWSVIDDAEIASLVVAEPKLRALCATLLSLANERGGRDNVTVVVARSGAAACL
jgi:PPM family protein phosphatase